MLVRACLRRRGRGVPNSTSCLSIRSPTTPPPGRLAQRRHAHSLPSLGAHNDYITSRGVEGLYSPEAVEQAWTRYQSMLLNRLSDIVAGDKYEHSDPKQILLDTARNPATANTFNYASMAHNNHFFWSTLSPSQKALPAELESAITRCFSSVHTFRSTFLQTAASMFGPGYVWLVMQHNPSQERYNLDQAARDLSYNLRILPTYMAGSPYPGAHARQQSRDLNTNNYESFRAANSPGALPSSAPQGSSATRYGGADVTPIMCVSTWEHSYILDWGADGRRLFLQAWWDRIDWDKVAGRAATPRSQTRRTGDFLT